MITCPRCGYQAPDGSPWCPRCGYGCPYPQMLQQQQPPQQLPAVYQSPVQQDPPQYEVYDIPPKSQKKKRKKKLSLFKKVLIGIGCFFGVILIGFIAIVAHYWNDAAASLTPTPDMEKMVQNIVDQTATAAILSATPTNTMISAPTATLIPTNTVLVRGSIAEEPTKACLIKGNVNDDGERFYHCPNGRSYDTVKIKPSEGDRWFCSEEEAIAAGFKHPANDPTCRY